MTHAACAHVRFSLSAPILRLKRGDVYATQPFHSGHSFLFTDPSQGRNYSQRACCRPAQGLRRLTACLFTSSRSST